MNWSRIARNLLSGPWRVRNAFSKAAMYHIERTISESERLHLGELRFAVEAALPLAGLLRGDTARDRAIEVFSQLRVWDTEHNNGVLIYLLLADQDVEIVADRGIHARVGSAGWERICHAMEQQFMRGEFERGVIDGITAITNLLQQHFPAQGGENPNEMVDAPVVL